MTDEAIRRFEAALMTLRKGDSALKARVLDGLTRALAFTGASAQAAAIGCQAVEMARRLEDVPTLMATLRASLFVRYARWGAEHIGERYAASTELLRLAEELRQPFNCELVKSDVFKPACGCYRAAT